MKSMLKRFTAVFATLAMTASLLAGCGGSKETVPTPTPAADKAKPFEGKNITLYMANHPWTNTVKELLPEFEAETGIKVDLQSFAEDQLTQKLTVQLTSGASAPDVFMHRPLQEGKLFAKNGWLNPLDEYVKNEKNYEFEDFFKSSIDSTTFDGKLMAIPLISEQQILYYRKDLLEKSNIPVPQTLDELEAAAKKLHNPDQGMYGFVARGQRSALVTAAVSFVFSEGGDYMNGDKATLTTPEALSGFDKYVNLLKNYGPPGVMNMSWPQALGVFAQGKAAFSTDGASLYSNLTDKEKSTVSDNVGFAVFPAGKAGSKPYNVTTWSLAMNSKSANKDAAWAFIQWATSKNIMLETMKKGNPGTRMSLWNNDEGVSGFPKDLVPIIKKSAEIGVGHDRPLVISVGEARDVVGEIVVKGLLGEDMKAAAEKANQDLQAIIDKDNQK